MADDLQGSAGDVIKHFVSIVVTSPVGVVTLVLSSFFGYGISFVLFDYRRSMVKRSHYPFHIAFGLGYAALMFAAVNFDLLSHQLTVDQIAQRTPLTLLVSFATSFLVMLGGGMWREFSKPYSGEGADGNRH